MPKTKLNSKFIQHWNSMKDIIKAEVDYTRNDYIRFKKDIDKQREALNDPKFAKSTREYKAKRLDMQLKDYDQNRPLMCFNDYMGRLSKIQSRENGKITLKELKGLKNSLSQTEELFDDIAEYAKAKDRAKKEENRIGYVSDQSIREQMNRMYYVFKDSDLDSIERAINYCEENDLEEMDADKVFSDSPIYYKPLVEEGVSNEKQNINAFMDIYKKLNELAKEFKKADSALHKDSKEYADMKKAFKETLELANRQNLNKDEKGLPVLNSEDVLDLGDKLEALGKAAEKYIKAKGAVTRQTAMGQKRMNAAISLLALSNASGKDEITTTNANNKDLFPSRERYSAYLEKQAEKQLAESGAVKRETQKEEIEEIEI